MTRDGFTACVEREQALARFKCEQELIRLDEGIARLDEGRLDEGDDITLESFDISFDTCEILAPLRFLFENRIMNIDSLIDVAKKGQTSVVKMILPYVDSSDTDVAIRVASQNGHTDVVKALLAYSRLSRPDPLAYDNNAIRYASYKQKWSRCYSQTHVSHQTRL